MAIRKIFQEGEELLLKKSREVTKFDSKLGELLDDMKDTMKKAEGVGLAAPQVGILRRAAIIDADGIYLEMINPVIIAQSGEQIDAEGCLSVDPSKNCNVKRPMTLTVEAYDRNGNRYQKELTGFAARACCHEVDHLDGILFYTKEYKPEKEEGKE